MPARVVPHRIAFSITVAALAALISLALLLDDSSAGIPVWSDPAYLNSNAPGGGPNDVQPALASGAGVWITAWISADYTADTGEDLDVFYSVSSDGGESWSDAAPLNSNATTDTGTDFVVSIDTDGAGNWIAVWQSDDTLGDTVDADNDIFFAVSTDNGATWSDVAPLNQNAAIDTGSDEFPVIVNDRAGRWIATWSSTDPLSGIESDYDILFSISGNNGAFWSGPSVLNTNAGTDSGNDQFPALAADGSGAWITAWQSDDPLDGTLGADQDILYSVSQDDGLNWSDPEALNNTAVADSGDDTNRISLATDRAGRWVAAWSSTDPLFGEIDTDFDILYSRSTNDGASWSPATPMNDNADTDSTTDYAVILAAGGGDWMAAWYSNPDGGDSDIYFSTSPDNGATWSDQSPLNTNAAVDSGADYYPYLATNQGGDWVSVWVSTDSLGNTIGTDEDILYAKLLPPPATPTPTPTPTPSPTPLTTPTPTPTPTGPTPTPTPTPTPSPTATPGVQLTQGDLDCDGDNDAVDALVQLQNVAGLPYNQNEPCPDVGADLAQPAGDPNLFGDVDCDGDTDAVDALKQLQFVAGIPYNQDEPCTDIGDPLA